MKLRNKKTKDICEAEAREDGIYIKANWTDREEWFPYDLETLASGWEYYVETAKPKRYRLLKDLPTFKAGDEFFTDEYGSLWLEQNIGERPNTSRVMAYHGTTIDKFPNILEEWFEEIKPDEPLVKNEEVRKAIRAWANAAGTDQAYLEIRHEEPSTFYVYKLTTDCHYIQIAFHDKNPIEVEGDYTIDELCGEEE